MIEQQTRTALEQQQWVVVINQVNPVPPKASLIQLWKTYANGLAVTLSIHDEAGQFVVYIDVGHAMTGSNRTEYGRFSTVEVAIQQLIQECYRWDRTWET
jgi:hypothetical protein